MSVDTAEGILDAIAPQFASDPGKADFVELAKTRTSQDAFGNKYNLAVALRAAHMMTLRDRKTGEGGAVSSKREGDLGISFATSASGKGELSQTHYGRQLQGLITGVILAADVTGG